MTVLASSGQSSLLLLLSVVVYLLGTHTGMAALRDVLRDDLGETRPEQMGPLRPEDRMRLMITAALAWGTALCVGFVLALASRPLPFEVGFQAVAVLVLWLLAVLVCFALVLALVRWPMLPERCLAGGALGVLALAVQTGWLGAASFKPGLAWRLELLVVAGLALAVGLALAFGVAFAEVTRVGMLRRRWRLAGAVLATLTLLAGQALLLEGMHLGRQAGSAHAHGLSSALLSLIGGVVVPLALLISMLTLHLSRRARSRRHHRDFTLTQLVEERLQVLPERRPRRSRPAARNVRGTAPRSP